MWIQIKETLSPSQKEIFDLLVTQGKSDVLIHVCECVSISETNK